MPASIVAITSIRPVYKQLQISFAFSFHTCIVVFDVVVKAYMIGWRSCDHWCILFTGADDVLPYLIYTLLLLSPKHMHSNLRSVLKPTNHKQALTKHAQTFSEDIMFTHPLLMRFIDGKLCFDDMSLFLSIELSLSFQMSPFAISYKEKAWLVNPEPNVG